MFTDIKISVLVPTYNHEYTLRRALDSILIQKNVLYEVIISDDFSVDNTRKIIQEYYEIHKEIIKVNFNDQNLGIVKNFNLLTKLSKGDVICWCSGDDELEKNSLVYLFEAIIENNINVKEDNFLFVTNHIIIYPTGKKIIFNNFNLKSKNLFKEQLRGGLSTRDFGICGRILRSTPLKEEFGPFGDYVRNLEMRSKENKIIFLNYISCKYYLGYGITSLSNMSEYTKNSIKMFEYIFKNMNNLDSDDIKFIKLKIIISKYFNSKNFIELVFNYFKMIFYIFINIGNYSENRNIFFYLRYLLPFYNSLSLYLKFYLKKYGRYFISS